MFYYFTCGCAKLGQAYAAHTADEEAALDDIVTRLTPHMGASGQQEGAQAYYQADEQV